MIWRNDVRHGGRDRSPNPIRPIGAGGAGAGPESHRHARMKRIDA